MKTKVTREKALETLAVLAAASLLLFFIFKRPAFAVLAAAFLVLALAFRGAAAVVAGWWLKFSEVLGRFNTALLLGLVYFLVLTPMALLFRLFTGRARYLKFDPAATSYFRERNRAFTPADLEKPW